MMIRKSHILLLLALALAVVACQSDGGRMPSDGDDGQTVTTIEVVRQQYKAAPGIAPYDENGDGSDDVGGRDDGAIIIDKFEEGSLLYFSQMGSTVDPNFDVNDETNYTYVYEYNGNESATWDTTAAYNFSLPKEGDYSTRKALDWSTVKSNGSVGNAFSFYAFYFPEENKPRFSVETDQTGAGKNKYDQTRFRTSDIMGAYHATSSLYTRMRFRLFHLMVYLKVTLYVPVYEVNQNNEGYSGFEKDALLGAFVMDACPEFSIEWHANRSSDTEAPLVQTKNDTKAHIRMYQHDGGGYIEEDFPIGEYYNAKDNKDSELEGKETDEVRVYNFSVLFPPQAFGDKDNFLCFVLQSPQADRDWKYYYFSGSQIKADTGNFGLTQGTLQHLSLYLPRHTNKTILVGANILPWADASTDMTVTPKPETQSDDEP